MKELMKIDKKTYHVVEITVGEFFKFSVIKICWQFDPAAVLLKLNLLHTHLFDAIHNFHTKAFL